MRRVMETNTINLGGALVYLPIAPKYSSTEPAPAHNAYVRHIQKRYQELNRNGNLPTILEKLPENSCLINKPFLANNEDFFIALFSDTKHDEACVRSHAAADESVR